MTCRNPTCRQPVKRCQATHPGAYCRGWVHSATGMHLCHSAHFLDSNVAEPEPGSLPVTEAPTSKPQGEVAC